MQKDGEQNLLIPSNPEAQVSGTETLSLIFLTKKKLSKTGLAFLKYSEN